MSIDIDLIDPATGNSLHWQNITHNLGRMAREAGIYLALWHPQDAGVRSAADLAEKLAPAVELMRNDPDRFRAHNAPNGWGTYDGFVPWLERLLEACRKDGAALIAVSR